MTARARHRAAVFGRDPLTCALAAENCLGELQADHILRVQVIERRRDELLRWVAKGQDRTPEQQRLVDTDLEDLVADGRNGWILCELHHGVKDRKLMVVDAGKLPTEFGDFIGDYGLEHSAKREGLIA